MVKVLNDLFVFSVDEKDLFDFKIKQNKERFLV